MQKLGFDFLSVFGKRSSLIEGNNSKKAMSEKYRATDGRPYKTDFLINGLAQSKINQ